MKMKHELQGGQRDESPMSHFSDSYVAPLGPIPSGLPLPYILRIRSLAKIEDIFFKIKYFNNLFMNFYASLRKAFRLKR